MLIQNESTAPAPAAVNGTSQKLLQLLRKRLRQLARVTFVLAIGLALAATALAIRWLASLNGLPDIGEPFDVAAFRAFSVPDDQNAFTFLRRADEALTPMPGGTRAAGVSGVVSWSQADPKLREWVEANRQAIELFQQGADQSEAANPAGESVVNGQRLALFVLLEGNRRQERGDTAGAWDCYRAVLRMATHTRRRGSLRQRQDLDAYWDGFLQQRLETWAADPRTTIPQLRNALDDVLKSEPRPDWDSFAIKAAYLGMMRALEQPVRLLTWEELGWEYTYRLGDMQLSPDMVGYLYAARRFLLREPERSRRVLRLLYANYLAHVEHPGRRKPAARARFHIAKQTSGASLYHVSPDAPADASALSPQEVASWLVTTNDIKLRIFVGNNVQWPWSPDRLRDRRAYSDLVLMLAREIYRRERGSLPPTDEALVGTYLKSLPDDGSADLADEMTPTVE
jgi:hypothetical protein